MVDQKRLCVYLLTNAPVVSRELSLESLGTPQCIESFSPASPPASRERPQCARGTGKTALISSDHAIRRFRSRTRKSEQPPISIFRREKLAFAVPSSYTKSSRLGSDCRVTIMKFEYVEPFEVQSQDECFSYHSVNLRQSGTIIGHWDCMKFPMRILGMWNSPGSGTCM